VLRPNKVNAINIALKVLVIFCSYCFITILFLELLFCRAETKQFESVSIRHRKTRQLRIAPSPVTGAGRKNMSRKIFGRKIVGGRSEQDFQLWQ
jgi:hypothetical protein